MWETADATKAPENISIAAKIPRQMDKEVKVTIEETGTIGATSMQVVGSVNVGFAAVVGSPSAALWSFVNAMQMVSYAPLTQVKLPPNAESVVQSMHSFVTLNAVQEILDTFKIRTIPRVSTTKSFNDSFRSVGISTSNPLQQMGSLNFFVLGLIVLPLIKLLIYFSRQLPCKCTRIR